MFTWENKRDQIETLFLLNRDFVYYYRDIYFYYDQSVIAAMSTVFTHTLKKRNRNSFMQERKIMFFAAAMHGFLTLDFYCKFSKNSCPE